MSHSAAKLSKTDLGECGSIKEEAEIGDIFDVKEKSLVYREFQYIE